MGSLVNSCAIHEPCCGPGGYLFRVLVFTVTLCSMALPAWAKSSETLTLGFFAYRPKPILEAQWQPLVDHLSRQMKGKRLLLRVLNQEEIQQALDANELDFVFTNPTHYIRLRTRTELTGALATLISLESGVLSPTLAGVVVRLKSRDDLQRFEDLRGKRVAVAGRQYLGGYTAQAHALTQRGIDPDDLNLVATGQPHDLVLQAVLDGRADAGFIRTGVLESIAREGTLDISQLVVMEPKSYPGFPFAASTVPYPEWPWVALPHVDAETARRMSSLLLGLESHEPVVWAAGIHGFSVPADYSRVEEAMMALRLPPFEKAPEITWADIWQHHRLEVTTSVLAALALAAFAVSLLVGNRRMKRTRHALALAAGKLEREHERLTNIITGTAAGTWEWSIPSGEVHVNERWAEMLGYTLDELQPTRFNTWSDRMHPDDLVIAQAEMQSHFSGKSDYYVCDARMRHKAGHWVWMHNRGKLLSRTPQGEPLLMSGTQHDITASKQSEASLALASRVFECSYDGILITDAANTIVNANPAFSRISGYSLDECRGRKPTMFRSGRHGDDFYAEIDRTLQFNGFWQGEMWCRDKSGEIHPLKVSMSLMRDAFGQVQHNLMVFFDISAQKTYEAELARIAHYDPLTGIPNRRLLGDRLKQAIAQARRTRQPVAVCMMDLDGFKQVNDTHGHEAGDQLLAEIARRLQQAVRADDTVARLGGDEFVMVFRDCTSPVVFERILAAVREPVVLEQTATQVSASLGVAYFRADTRDGDQLLREADQAMYQSKIAGRNRYTLWCDQAG